MPIAEKYSVDFCEDDIFHVYNRTNNKELLFANDENRTFFLRKYRQYLSPFVETFCWCLMSNHFHILLRVKKESEILAILKSRPRFVLSSTDCKFIQGEIVLSQVIERIFTRFFQSYTLAFNKMHNRKGNLFYKSFKRLLVSGNDHLLNAILYIHANPVHHGVVKSLAQYKWSSFHEILSGDPTWLNRNDVLDWFGGRAAFIKAHTGVNEPSALKCYLEE